MYPRPLFADDSLVTQEFRYHVPGAGEVFLVWGIDGWQQVPAEARPAGTVVEFGVMHTPMDLDGDEFIARVQVPVGTKLDYGFQIRTRQDGTTVEWIWDGDYQMVPTAAGVTEVNATVRLPRNQLLGGSFRTPLSLFIAFSLAFAIGTILVMRKAPTLPSLRFPLSSRRLVYLRDLLGELVARDFKLRYKRSVLGVVWSLLNPLAQLLVFYFIFGAVVPLNIPNYAIFLFTGLLVWTWFQTSLLTASSVIVDNPDLIRRPGFPAAILPVVTVVIHHIHFLLALPILLIFLVYSGIQITSAIVALPLLILLQFLLTLSLAYLVAAMHVVFRDTQYLLGIFLMFGFYLSPIFYATAIIPARYQFLYHLNPMVDLIDAYRSLLMQGTLPDVTPLLIIGVVATGLLWLGYKNFIRTSYRFVEEL